MDVSVIIVNYNTLDLTNDCITSIVEHSCGIDYEIILVDNASSDGSKDFFIKDNRIKYIYNEQNVGFGPANNIGASSAHGKYLFFLNSDTLLLNNALKLFFDYAEKHDHKTAYGGFLSKGDKSPACSSVEFPRTTFKEYLGSVFRRRKKRDHHNYGNLKSVDAIAGADIFMLKEDFDNVNGFDEHIFLFGEEVELQYRLKKLGIARILIPEPQIIHFTAESTKKTKNNYTRIKMNGHFVFLKKHTPWYFYYTARLYYGLRFLLMLPSSNNKKELVKTAFMSINLD